MVSMYEFPEIMRNAREDLAGNVSGEFSPADWESILQRAHVMLSESKLPPADAWVAVIRDFHKSRYWGFTPDYLKPKTPAVHRDEKNLGYQMLYYGFRSFLFTKVVVVWTGALYTATGDPFWLKCFCVMIVFMVCSYGTFLYKFGGRTEKYESKNNEE